MTRLWLILVGVLLLAGCKPPPGADGYQFAGKEYDLPTVTVTLVQHPDAGSLRAAAAKAGAPIEGDREIMAWSVLHGATCTVHVIDPAASYQPQWLGHEIAHCFWGRWHG
jgi:hypothetical protein